MSSPRSRSAPSVPALAKRILSPLAVAWLCLAALALGPREALTEPNPQPNTARANARQLLAISRQALADTARAAGAARIDRGNSRHHPFWTCFDEMARSLERIGDSMRARDPRLLEDLRAGTRALEALNTVWRWTGAGDTAAVTTSLQAVSVSYRLLRSQYGREALRARHGGTLTGAERRQLEAWQRTQRRLAARLEVLQAEAARQHRARMEEELRRLAERSQRIAFAPVTLAAYLEASETADTVQGEWDGTSYYAEPEDAPIWEDTYEIVEELSAEEERPQGAPAAPLEDADPGVVILANLATGESWSFLEDETEIPAELGFRLSEEIDESLDAMPAVPAISAEEIPDGELWASQGIAEGGGPDTDTADDVETVDVVEPERVLNEEPAAAPAEKEPAAAGVRIPILGKILKL
ncbi:MAG TPA: hypothetical protein VHN15_05385 [Thermoanaerobaculia bacterium]|nr:hypothetical protein [Thermoanaerobaculia bacterium]